MQPTLPIIYLYIDFRKYLDEYRRARVLIDEGFTHNYVCHRLGMKNSRSYFNNIVKGRKNVSTETVQKLITLLELSSAEASYFRTLVNYNQTKEPEEKKYYFDQLLSLNATPRKIIDEKTYRYFTTWYYPVVRELLDTFNFNGDYRELAQKLDPPITVKQAKEAVALLEQLELIEQGTEGYFKPTNRVISTADNVQHHLVEQFQLNSFEHARDSIIRSNSGHKTTTMTVALSKDALESVLGHLNHFRTAVRAIANQDDLSDKKVYEVILHMHTQSK